MPDNPRPDNPRTEALRQAVARLEEALALPQNDVARDSSIKRFELCFELSWKAVQDFLRHQGLPCRSPKDCFQEAFAYGLLAEDELWASMVLDRNLSVHTYDQALADQLYNRLACYAPAMRRLVDEIAGGGPPPRGPAP